MGMEKNKVNRTLGVALIILIVGFAAVILLQISSIFLGPSRKACTKKVCLKKFLEGPPAFNDEGLRSYVVGRHYVQSNGPPNYSEKVGFNDTIEEAMSFILDYFQGKRDGTFVVLGAGDGEYQDLTIPLEKQFGWKGFLVEPHPELFEMLKKKGRKGTLSNNCVSPFAYPSMTNLGYPKIAVGDSEVVKFNKYRKTKVKQLFQDDTDIAEVQVQCIPLENLLYSAGIEKELDLMVLEMSGSDLDVLTNVKLDILPETEMIVVRAHGASVGTDVGGYFLDINLVLKKVIGTNQENSIYIITKFKVEEL